MGAYYIKTIKGMEEAGDELELELLKEEKYDSSLFNMKRNSQVKKLKFIANSLAFRIP